MALVKIYSGEPCWLTLKFSEDPLAVYNKTYSDITEVYMGLKMSSSDADDKYLSKLQSLSEVIVDQVNHEFKMELTENDLVPPNQKPYFIACGVLLNGLTKMIWLRQDMNSKNGIIVEEDFVEQ